MSKVDWSLAPEGATHFLPAKSESHCDVWFKFDGGYVVSAGYDRANGWAHSYTKDCQPSTEMTRLISRKDDETKPWSGPEDGLPPAGTVCEYQTIGATNDWQEVEILCHFTAQKEVAVFVPVKGYRNVKQAIAECFRPIKTLEQLAADQRETAIRELMDIAQVDCRVTAARLVDAGFKREVV